MDQAERETKRAAILREVERLNTDDTLKALSRNAKMHDARAKAASSEEEAIRERQLAKTARELWNFVYMDFHWV